MPQPSERTDEYTFVELWEKLGAEATAKKLKMSLRGVYQRRARLEKKFQRQIQHVAVDRRFTTRVGAHHPARLEYDLRDGIALVGSDLHIWPGDPPVMHRAFVKFCVDLEPQAVILNGDVLDMAAVSRHAPIGWEHRPTVQQEIEAGQDRLSEIEKVVKRGVPKIWTLGNHDGRFETRLATVAPEYAKIHGVHLKDHFSHWEPCWSVWLNDTVIKHRFRGGIHAVYNNTLHSGKHIVTGHLHSAKVTPFTDYNGTRYGVDGGCMADTNHDAFVHYTEDNPLNWRSAFVVLTFRNRELLFPELVVKYDEKHVQFRGEVIKC